MNRGYVRLWRASLDKAIFKNANLWQFATWCLMKATHKKMKQMVGYQVVELEPGQFVFGRDKAAEELLSTPQKIRTCIHHMIKLGFLTINTTNKFSVITVINWELYQPEEKQNNQQPNQQVTSRQPTSNHKQEHKEQYNNYKPPLPPLGGTAILKKYKYPDWLDRSLWSEFVKMRARLKKPITSELAITRLLNRLSELIKAGYDQKELFGLAMEKCWLSFYAPKGQVLGSVQNKNNRDHVCPHCKVQANNIERNSTCPYCGQPT